MEQIDVFSPERLRLARQRRGLFKQELAARVGVSVRAVTAWESGDAPPSEEHLAEIVRILAFPREFFFGDAPPILRTAAFRSLARMTARQRDMALAAGSEAVALDMWVSDQFRRPAPNVPDFPGGAPEVAADGVRAAWGLGYKPIPNVIHRLEANGIRVYSLVHDGGEIDAFSDWQNGTPYVFLNTSKTAERSRMDAAHELGHLVLHAHSGGPSSKEEEDDAKAFASAFLMPGPAFVASMPRRITLATIIEAKQRWGVSALAYVYRLWTLGRISKWQYNSLCIQIKSAYPATEPGPERRRETSQVLAKVMAPNPATVRREIVKHLRIPLRNLDEITFGLALTPIAGNIRSEASASRKATKAPTSIQLMK
jgi:Zn-dependent peptidase ImmA (M78 family)/transcriptional regulator with XRE-family HTH domain